MADLVTPTPSMSIAPAPRTMPAQKPGRSKQDYATPRPFLAAVKRRLGIQSFEMDLAADSTNAVCPRYLTEEMDALATPWRGLWMGWAWLNPPFADIGPWARKCAETGSRRQPIAFLVPAAVGANWFRDFVDGRALVLFLNGRLKFMPDKPTWLYPKDCILALYGLPPGYEVWNWRKEC
jgi:phage N-6-adenine-methyltransferase